MKTNNAGYIIDAYPCTPSFHQGSEEEEKDFWRQLSEIPDILGLKQPCLENFHLLGDQQLLRHTPEGWKFVVTAAMETMHRCSESSGFGLASSDEEQRQACVVYYRHLSNKINSLRVNKALVLRLQAAPLATNLNAMQATDVFARSLKEIASWDRPYKLVLEHRNAMTSSSPQKDFLPLENVLEVITDYDTSICINWARSATEGRNTTLPLIRTQMAKQVRRLGTLMFSGTTLNGVYGEWQDLHAPSVPLCAESLVTTDHVLESFNVAESSTLYFTGTKLPEVNATADVRHCIEILRNGIHSLNESRQTEPLMYHFEYLISRFLIIIMNINNISAQKILRNQKDSL